VDHNILAEAVGKHSNLGLPQGWFRSLLENRKMYVQLKGQNSAQMPLTRGVPQGSSLGPLLFNIYYNDVVKRFKHADITLFADDTALMSAASNTRSLMQSLQCQLTQIDTHLTKLRMELNSSKTFFLIFRSSSNDNGLTLQLRDSSVKQCDSFKYLGMHIDNDLTWKTHVGMLTRKVQKILYVLHRCSGKSNNNRRILLFRSYVYPHFLYGIQLYMFCSVSLRAKLEALFRRCCRLATRDLDGRDDALTFRLLNVLPLRLTFQYSSAVMLYSVLVLKQIPALSSLFTIIAPTNYNARLIREEFITLRLPAIKLESSRHGFAYWGAKLWNSIPAPMRSCNSLGTFSELYHDYLVSRLSDVSNDHYDLLDFV
jgi:Reverse transcriptase (RNA-dependent DNA polymerase)